MCRRSRAASLLVLAAAVAAANAACTAPPTGDSRDAGLSPERIATREARRARTAEDFDHNGVLPGQTVPDVEVVTLDGSPSRLSKLWQEKPTLLVTASLTCGRSRDRHPRVEEIANKFGDRINVAVLYTIEAHPVIDPSPYAVYSPELENPEHPGERAGGNRGEPDLERRQPTELEERRILAEAFKDLLRVEVPIVLDPMDNAGWKALGGGPNMGLLIRSDGTLAVKQGWFVADAMDRSIEQYLAEAAKGTG